MPLLPELNNLIAEHDLDDVLITVTADGYVRMYTFTTSMAALASNGYDVWMYEGSEMLTKATVDTATT